MDEESLRLVMPKLSETMSASNFKSMMSRQTVSQKNKIEVALKGAATQPDNSAARSQLANLKGTLGTLNSGYEKENYFSNISLEQMGDLVSSKKGRSSLEDFLTETKRFGKLSGKTIKEIEEEINKDLNKMQLNSTSPIGRGILQEIKKIVG